MTPLSPQDSALPGIPRPGSADSGTAPHPAVPAAPGTASPVRARGTNSSSPSPSLPGVDDDGAREEGPGSLLRPDARTSPAQDPAGGARSDSAPPAAPSGTTWTVELPAGLKLLSLNQRHHWAEANRIYQSLKKAAWAMTLNARVPHLERVAVEAVYDPPDRRHRDPDNLAPSLKACLDGIVASGRVIPADDSRYVASTACSIGEVYPRGRLRLIIREVGSKTRRGAA